MTSSPVQMGVKVLLVVMVLILAGGILFLPVKSPRHHLYRISRQLRVLLAGNARREPPGDSLTT